jgi:hypothetical protein
MACNSYQLFYNASGVLSATYLNCGDRTSMTIALTGGGNGALYGTIYAATYLNNPSLSATSLVVYTGSAPASGISYAFRPVPNLRPWVQYTSVALTSGVPAF